VTTKTAVAELERTLMEQRCTPACGATIVRHGECLYTGLRFPTLSRAVEDGDRVWDGNTLKLLLLVTEAGYEVEFTRSLGIQVWPPFGRGAAGRIATETDGVLMRALVATLCGDI
tara:strand:- start:226 stop:570 length:345 start_codon:yes stop_codon:yes gene_type:complete